MKIRKKISVWIEYHYYSVEKCSNVEPFVFGMIVMKSDYVKPLNGSYSSILAIYSKQHFSNITSISDAFLKGLTFKHYSIPYRCTFSFSFDSNANEVYFGKLVTRINFIYADKLLILIWYWWIINIARLTLRFDLGAFIEFKEKKTWILGKRHTSSIVTTSNERFNVSQSNIYYHFEKKKKYQWWCHVKS